MERMTGSRSICESLVLPHLGIDRSLEIGTSGSPVFFVTELQN